MQNELLRLLYGKRESALLLGISDRELDHQLALGELQFRRVGKRVLIPRSELLRFAESDHRSKSDA
jgi:excisionase family DNA binding protein